VSINYDQPELSIVAIALLIVVVATMLCNLLVGFALMRFRSLRNVSNMLIGNLALSDFLLSVGVLPLSAVNECLGHWVFGQTACNVWLLVDVLFCTSSIWNLCIIAFDRFTATFYPLWYRGVGRTNPLHAFLYAAVVWTIAAAACLPPLFNWNDLSANYVVEHLEPPQLDVVDSCRDQVVYRCVLFRSPSYVLYSASVSFYVPCLVTFILYINILVELRRRRRKTEALKRDRHQLQVRSRTPAPSAVVPPTSERGNCDGIPALADSTRAPMTSAVVSWMLERNDDHDQHPSNDSSLASPTHSLSIHSQDDEPITALNDDDVIQAPAQRDVTSDLQNVNELTPIGDLSPASNSTGPRRSVAETFIRGFSHFSHR